MPVYFTKSELENLKKIAQNYSSIDIRKLEEIQNHLQNYINANQDILEDEEKQKKVQAARKLIYYMEKPNGPLYATISDMRQNVSQIDGAIEEMGDAEFIDAEPYLNINNDSIFRNLSLMNPEGENNMGFDQALTTFLEGEDFAEYREGGVVRDALAGVKASQQANEQYSNLMDLGRKRAFRRSNVFEDFEQKRQTLVDQLVMPLIVSRGKDHLSFMANDNEMEQIRGKLAENNSLIPELTQKYKEAFLKEQDAEKKYREIQKKLEPVDAAINAEYEKLRDLELQKEVLRKKNELQKAIATLSRAYEKMKGQPAQNWPFAKEAADEALLEQAKNEYKEKAKLLDQNLVVESLVGKDAPNRDYTKKMLHT